MKVLVKVTEDHINSGIRHSCSECPVSLAICELIRDDVRCDTGYIFLTLTDLFTDYQYNINYNKQVKDFIIAFDYGKQAVKPFSFELSIPDELLKPEISSGIQSESVAQGNWD